jgi:D-alanine--poly(phosphoribitol) ligase subunit 1
MKRRYCYNLGLLFSEVAAAHAGRPAIKFPSGAVHTYRELDERSNQLGNYLRQKGILPGEVVAILNNKSFDAYALLLACIKTGIIYTNLDVSSPLQRLDKILSNCRPRLIAFEDTASSVAANIASREQTQMVNIGSPSFLSETGECDKSPLTEIMHQVNGSEPAYIMFTSGSTGFPKGALMSHDNVLNLIAWGQETFNVTEKDIFTNVNPIYFDNSVFDFYVSIFSGACLVPFTPDLVADGARLVRAVNEARCTFWFSVPSLLVYLLTTRSIKSSDFPHLSRISFGGEGFPKPKLKQLYDLLGERVTLYNVYGPTECTCICSSYRITPGDFENLNELAPLGHMAPNFGYVILPVEGQPDGIGELALTGPNVGLGYYNDPERTSRSFVQHPDKIFFQRIYKTGDLVEKRTDGLIYFKGRVDNQIKHMGYRIELEEVEAGINALSYINEAGVIYQQLGPGLGQLVAFVYPNSDLTEQMLMNDLKKILPPYMLPKRIVLMGELPKNRNGKIDRIQLTQMRTA